nr:EamA family transporter [Corynebacterium aquatimens]
MVLVGSVALHTSNAIASTLFATYGSQPVSAMRMMFAALILLVLVRPRVRGRSRGEWLGIVVYGAAMAVMNGALYHAIERIPLGIASTIEFLGPCAVALVQSRRWREAACALLALAGVALLSAGPAGFFDAAGYAFAVCAAVAFGVYTLFAPLVGNSGADGLALSIAVAAVFTSPWSAPVVVSGGLDVRAAVLLAASAVLGVVITFGADTLAAKMTSARVVGTLFAIDPAMSAIIGKLALGQDLTAAAVAGIVVVASAGALLVWSAESEDVSEPPID